MTPATSIGEAWRQARHAMGKSQEETAIRLGISESYLSLIENNRRTPPIPLLRRMAELSSWSMEALTPTPLDT